MASDPPSASGTVHVTGFFSLCIITHEAAKGIKELCLCGSSDEEEQAVLPSPGLEMWLVKLGAVFLASSPSETLITAVRSD